MDQALELIVAWSTTTTLYFLIVGYDERRLRPEQLERAWPPSSKWSAIVGFGPVAVLVHFIRTRRGIGGVLLGVIYVLAVGFVTDLVTNGALWAYAKLFR
jgi:hypothetical protein